MADETYFSIDVEADGPIPGMNSMLSFGVGAYDSTGKLLDTYSANLENLDGATTAARTMGWWGKQPKAWAALQQDRRDPGEVMTEFCHWVEGFPGPPVGVRFPAGFDFTFLFWYLHRFVGRSPFSHSCLDMKTIDPVLLGGGYRQTSKSRWPRRLVPEGATHTHVALDDALEQGFEFFSMLREIRARIGPWVEPADLKAVGGKESEGR